MPNFWRAKKFQHKIRLFKNSKIRIAEIFKEVLQECPINVLMDLYVSVNTLLAG